MSLTESMQAAKIFRSTGKIDSVLIVAQNLAVVSNEMRSRRAGNMSALNKLMMVLLGSTLMSSLRNRCLLIESFGNWSLIWTLVRAWGTATAEVCQGYVGELSFESSHADSSTKLAKYSPNYSVLLSFISKICIFDSGPRNRVSWFCCVSSRPRL